MKKFLIINGHIYLEDHFAAAVSFNSATEYAIYTGKDAPTDYQMNYEPDNGIYTSYDGTTEMDLSASIPVADLEDSIANIANYQMAQRDPYFAASLNEAKQLKYDEVKEYAQTLADAAELVPHVSTTYTDLDEARAERLLTTELFSIKMAAEVVLTANEIIKAHVYYDLSLFRNAVNDEAVDTKTPIAALTSVTEVTDFDVETDVTWSVWIPAGT